MGTDGREHWSQIGVRTSNFGSLGMELNGARSNPISRDKDLLRRLSQLHQCLLDRAESSPRQPRPAPPKASPVLETITLVLELAAQPMRAQEIHIATQELTGETLLWTSVK